MKISQKIYRSTSSFFATFIVSCLVTIMVIGVLPLNTIAVDSVKVVVGNHEYSEDTNMVLEFELTEDSALGDTWDIYFDTNDNHADTAGIVNSLSSGEDITMTVSGITGECYAKVTNNTYDFDLVSTTAQDKLTLTVPTDGSCIYSALTTGKVVKIYLGNNDSGSHGNSGVYSSVTASHTNTHLNNPSSGDHVDVDVEIYDSGSTRKSLGSGAYALVSADEEVLDMRATIDPSITLNCINTNSDFGAFSSDTIKGGVATLNIAVNSETGYVLRYRASELTNGTHNVGRNTDGGALLNTGNGEWGINLAGGNTDVVGDSLPVSTGINNYNNDFGGGGTYGIATGYEGNNVYRLTSSDDVLETLLINNGPAVDSVKVSVAMKGSLDLSAGEYDGAIVFNIYAGF